MSRIGKAPIELPAGVDFKVDGKHVTVKGPKGQLEMDVVPEIDVTVEGNVVHVTRPSDEKKYRSLHGLTRTLVHNMVVGVTDGFQKTLEINGVGYRAQKDGKNLVMNLGYSHPVTVSETDDIQIDVPNPNTVVVKGIDKQKVGQFAAELRMKRPPEPYKGKGIKYDYEVIRRKEGKTGAK
jgi:large subunit ribosomal protein L6